MAEFPALPLWTDAHIGDTQHLSMEENGCYLHLLMIAWRREDCALDDDDEKFARMCRMSTAKWRKIRVVLEPFFTIHTGENGTCGKWTQKRLTEERDFVTKKSEQSREAANSRWLKTNKTGNAGAYANAIPPHPHPHPFIKDKTYPQEEVERCATCGGVFPDPATGRLSGCTCPPDQNWKPRPLPPGLATIRTNAIPDAPAPSPPPAPAAADDGNVVEFDVGKLIGSIGKAPGSPKPSSKANGASPPEPPKAKVSWRRNADGSFERT